MLGHLHPLTLHSHPGCIGLIRVPSSHKVASLLLLLEVHAIAQIPLNISFLTSSSGDWLERQVKKELISQLPRLTPLLFL